MKYILSVAILLGIIMTTGCHRSGTLSVTEAEFDRIMAKAFDTSKFVRVGSGLSGGIDEIEYEVFFRPKSSTDPIHFDFSEWESFLNTKGSYSNTGSGGSDGLYWRQTWANDSRSLVIDAVVMKNGEVKATYRETMK